MTPPVLRASVRAVPTRTVGMHLAAAVLLTAVCWRALDTDSGAVLVLRGVAVLLATALALSVDEPSGALLDATPTPLVQRLTARLVVCASLVLPCWALAVGAAALAGADVPVAALTLELAALVALGLAVPSALRRWWGVPEPAVVTGPVLLGALLGALRLPEALSLLPFTPLDPAWGAAHGRWTVVLLASATVLAVAVSDPATARGRRR